MRGVIVHAAGIVLVVLIETILQIRGDILLKTTSHARCYDVSIVNGSDGQTRGIVILTVVRPGIAITRVEVGFVVHDVSDA